jgi:hypothetical protein
LNRAPPALLDAGGPIITLPIGREFPVCFILGNEDGMPRLEGSKPGAVWLWRSLPVPVRRYVFE